MLVNQTSALPTNKLTAAIVTLAVVKAIFAVTAQWYPVAQDPAVINAAEIVIPFLAGYLKKDRAIG